MEFKLVEGGQKRNSGRSAACNLIMMRSPDSWKWLIRHVALAAAGAALALCSFTGCAPTAVIAAAGVTAGFGLAQGQAEAFFNGELKAARMVTLEQAYTATMLTLEEVQVNVLSTRHGKYDAYIMAKAEGRPEIKIHIKNKTPVVTKFEIRIGIAGDQAVSRLVMARIDAKLGIDHPIVPVEISPIVAPMPATVPSREHTAPATQPFTPN